MQQMLLAMTVCKKKHKDMWYRSHSLTAVLRKECIGLRKGLRLATLTREIHLNQKTCNCQWNDEKGFTGQFYNSSFASLSLPAWMMNCYSRSNLIAKKLRTTKFPIQSS